MILKIRLRSDLEEQLEAAAQRSGLSVEQYSAKVLIQHLEDDRKRQATVELLESWLAGDEAEQKATGEALLRSLDEDRLSARPLFPSELKNVTW